MIFLFPKVGYVNPLEGMYLQCPALPFHHWDGDPGVGRRSVKRRAPRASAEAPLAWKGFCSEWSRILWRKPDTLKGDYFQPQDIKEITSNHEKSWIIQPNCTLFRSILDHIGPLSFMLSPGPAAPDLETDTEVGWSWRMLREDEFWGMPSFCCWY